MKTEAINWGSENPRKLFLLDGLGALLSAFLLGVVLVKFESIFGIPKHTLYLLAIIPCFFACYDFFCYQWRGKNIAPFLKGIAIMNMAYCFLSLGLAVYHSLKITALGWAYIIIEVIIVISLAVYEYKVGASLNSKE